MGPEDRMIPNSAADTVHASVIFGASNGIKVRSMPSINVTNAQSATTRTWVALMASWLIAVEFAKTETKVRVSSCRYLSQTEPALADLPGMSLPLYLEAVRRAVGKSLVR